MEMKCILNIGKNIFILAKVTQVSDVAHGPIVTYKIAKLTMCKCNQSPKIKYIID
jgi:hypothetical protein